jgi:hypothetical protein
MAIRTCLELLQFACVCLNLIQCLNYVIHVRPFTQKYLMPQYQGASASFLNNRTPRISKVNCLAIVLQGL